MICIKETVLHLFVCTFSGTNLGNQVIVQSLTPNFMCLELVGGGCKIALSLKFQQKKQWFCVLQEVTLNF